MAVERKGLSSSDQAVCTHMGWAFLPRGWAVRAGVHNGAELAGRGGGREAGEWLSRASCGLTGFSGSEECQEGRDDSPLSNRETKPQNN